MRFRFGTWRQVAAVLVFAAATSISQPLRAELIVQSSTVPDYAPASRHADDTVFEVPDGKYLKLLKETDGRNAETFRIVGPYKGTLADYGQCAWYLFGFCGNTNREDSDSGAYVRGDGQDAGATRGLKPKPKAE